MRLIFMGTAELAAEVLSQLARVPAWQVAAVVSQPDRPRSRNLEVMPTPVKAEALRSGLPLLQPESARSPDFLAQVASIGPDLVVVAAYGQLLSQSLLDLANLGCLNVHTSLLPRYRGAAPIQWAIANGETMTGVTIMKMDAGLDTGPIIAQEPVPIHATDTGGTLHDRLATVGAALLVRAIPLYASGLIVPSPQNHQNASHARKLTREDGRIDWGRPAIEIWNRLRGFTPWPGAYCYIPGSSKPRLLKLHAAELAEGTGSPGQVLSADDTGLLVACGKGALRISQLQLEGGRRLSGGQFSAGHRFTELH